MVLVGILLPIVVLQSCSNRQEDGNLWKIGFSQCTDDEWRIKMNEDLLREAQLYNNVCLDIKMAHGNNQQQIEDINDFIADKVDLLIVSPNEAVAITPVVEKAYNSGIPVIVVDRKVFTDCYTAFIAADNFQIGQAVGHYIRSLLPMGGKVVEITGLMGSTPAIERHQGFINVISNHPEIKILDTWDSEWKRESAYEKTLSLLDRQSDIDVVFAHNDIMAYGAYCAAMSRGCEAKIKFIGVDALPGETNGVGLVSSGKMNATFIYPSGVETIVKTAIDILEGRKYNKETILSTAIINKTNVKVMEMQGSYISEQEKKIEKLSTQIGDYTKSIQRQRFLLYISLLMVVAVIIGLAAALYLLKSKNRLNRILVSQNAEIRMKTRQMEEQQQQLVDLTQQVKDSAQAKLVFFTNISHDIRTPLSLILGPLEQLMNNPSLTEEQRRIYISLASKNADVLKKLVDQLLLFRKFEQGKMSFNAQPTMILHLIKEWNDSFVLLLHQKSIKFNFLSNIDEFVRVNADVEKLERVYYNILSNAYKFTPEGGKIDVSVESIKDIIQIKVFNSDSFIPNEEVDTIFERFYQRNNEKHQTGVGIGLALTKAFVEMHNGKIRVESIQGVGTTFIVEIPQCERSQPVSDGRSYDEAENYEDGRNLLLLVDDNEDVLSYLSSILSSEYNLIFASDGKQGIKKALQYIPDLIITDVMMPNMDGREMVQYLKNTIQTSHIPVIMLTAKAIEQSRKEGYESGADSYIAKPFNSEVLRARILNLINGRKILRDHKEDVPIVRNIAISQNEQEFMLKLDLYIDQNISNSELGIDDICHELGVSRTLLYRRVKALADLAPNEYVRVCRLKKAKELLCTTTNSITEIGYAVGFSSPSYFIKCFREYFNETPSSFIKHKTN